MDVVRQVSLNLLSQVYAENFQDYYYYVYVTLFFPLVHVGRLECTRILLSVKMMNVNIYLYNESWKLGLVSC